MDMGLYAAAKLDEAAFFLHSYSLINNSSHYMCTQVGAQESTSFAEALLPGWRETVPESLLGPVLSPANCAWRASIMLP